MQYDDGVIAFPIEAGLSENLAARKHRLIWKYKATRWGKYDVLLFTKEFSSAADVKMTIGENQLTRTISKPLSPNRLAKHHHQILLGTVYLAKAGPLNIDLTVPNSFQPELLVLKPAAEGKPIVQNNQNGEIVMHARDATVLGTVLRYEPKPEKNTLGYWINKKDRAIWEFQLNQPGKYEVEILQGCGTGQGGSEVYLEIKSINKQAENKQAEKAKPQRLPWVVIDTGHFQNFKPFQLGMVELKEKGAKHRLTVYVKQKKQKAVMDLRHVILRPVNKL